MMDGPVSQKTEYDASIFFHQYDHANGNALLVFYCVHYYRLFALDWQTPSGSTMSISSTTIFLRTAPRLYAIEKLSYQFDSWTDSRNVTEFGWVRLRRKTSPN